jgi:hypothetical protein
MPPADKREEIAPPHSRLLPSVWTGTSKWPVKENITFQVAAHRPRIEHLPEPSDAPLALIGLAMPSFG